MVILWMDELRSFRRSATQRNDGSGAGFRPGTAAKPKRTKGLKFGDPGLVNFLFVCDIVLSMFADWYSSGFSHSQPGRFVGQLPQN